MDGNHDIPVLDQDRDRYSDVRDSTLDGTGVTGAVSDFNKARQIKKLLCP